ncbi:hypothetical protein L7F22_004416 [Adiantum nelumboides]|nr:hypothetical protein [Adiantum nelumboides]
MNSSHTNSNSICEEDMTSLSTSSGLPTFMYGNSKSSFSSPRLPSSSLPSHSSASTPSVRLSLGDTVHLRCITGSHQAHLQDALQYSCLAILKAYFQQTEGLLSYTFYRSLDGSRMAGLGVWRGADAASTFLNAPDGACEERYWRSMGTKARFEIYDVAALIA